MLLRIMTHEIGSWKELNKEIYEKGQMSDVIYVFCFNLWIKKPL